MAQCIQLQTQIASMRVASRTKLWWENRPSPCFQSHHESENDLFGSDLQQDNPVTSQSASSAGSVVLPSTNSVYSLH